MPTEQYARFLKAKSISVASAGFVVDGVNQYLFDWQVPIVRWALRKGRAAIFADCGLGKTLMQLSWAHEVHIQTGGNILVLAPLAVAEQTKAEGVKFGIPSNVCRKQADVEPGINITNYEMFHEFDASSFGGVVLDESSILKAHDSKTRNALTAAFAKTPYRLCCSATPAPNDHMELATHAEFLGMMKRAEMLSMFFVHDGGETSKWRLKGHAADDFWKWISSGMVMIRKPSDIGFSDHGFTLPPIHRQQVTVEPKDIHTSQLFQVEAKTLTERRDARRASLSERVESAAHLANVTHRKEAMLLWCDLNAESEALTAAVPDAVEVTGSQSNAVKAKSMSDFIAGRIRVLVSKPSICGYGLNLQHCRNMAFVGLSDSFEQVYQAERRCWRFGQDQVVNSYVITSKAEGAVVRNQERKLEDFETMSSRMIENMKAEMQKELGITRPSRIAYAPRVEMTIPSWLKEIA